MPALDHRETQPSTSRRRRQEPSSPGRSTRYQPTRRQSWAGKSPKEILARYTPGKASPEKVLEVLIELFNTLHTSLEKTVSHKTRHERAHFLGQKHIRAMVQVWKQDHLTPATIQTYLSFLRGLGMWMGKHGFVRSPAYYGLIVDEYQRHEYAQRDKSWSAQGIDIDALINDVCAFDGHVGACLRLIRAFGLRRKEAIQFRPFEHVLPFAETGLPPDDKAADRYVRIKGKGGRVRWLPLESPARVAAVAFAQDQASSRDAHMGDPTRDLKRNLRRFDYVMEKFGITLRGRGATGHGLRHEVLMETYTGLTGALPPVRGGGPVAPEGDIAARRTVSALAGHARIRASGAYLGAVLPKLREQPATRRGAPPPRSPGDDEAPGPVPT
jgi:site-specific recombinase XerC